MSKIIELANKHFGSEWFTSSDFSIKTGIDTKVAAMNLSKLSYSHKIGRFIDGLGEYHYKYRTVEEINAARSEENKTIEKYNLRCKKWDLI